jgi:hypothetical protein
VARSGLAVCAALLATLALTPGGGASSRLRPCGAPDLHAYGELQGATGSMLGPIVFRNVSSSSCRLGGRPRVAIHDRAGRLLPTRELPLTLREIRYRAVTSLRPGGRASLYLLWSEWCGPWPSGVLRQRLLLHVTLTTGKTLRASFDSGRPRCDVHTGSRLVVTPFGVSS